MASYVVDKAKAIDLLRRYRPDLTVREVGGRTEVGFVCPFHADTSASFSFNVEKGVGNCFSCHAKGHLHQLIAKFEGSSEEAANILLKKQKVTVKEEVPELAPVEQHKEQRRKLVSCGYTLAHVEDFHKRLLQTASKLEEIVKATGWTQETLAKWKIGLDGERFTIPAILGDVVHNIKYYMPNGKPKYSGVDGHNQMYLWPLDNMDKQDIYLMEGEKDCILANQLGLNAVTFSGGSHGLPKEFIRYFQNKNVTIVYDIDDAGKSGAKEVADILARVAHAVKIVNLPTEQMPPNGDFSDFINKAKGNIAQIPHLANMTDAHIYTAGSRIAIPHEVIDTYLESLVGSKLFFKRVRMRVRVISCLTDKTYIVPQEVKIKCDKNWADRCSPCPMFYSNGESMLTIKPEFQELLLLVETNLVGQKQTIGSIMDIPPKCPKFKIETASYQYMYPVVFIPALEKDKPYHSYTMQRAWAFSEPAEANEDYLAECIVFAHPDTQQIALVCYKLEKDIQSADEFELSPEMIEALKVFQPVMEQVCQTSTPSPSDSQTSTTTSPATSPISTEDKTSTSSST